MYAEQRWMMLCLAEFETAVVVTSSGRNYITFPCLLLFALTGVGIEFLFPFLPSLLLLKMLSEIKEGTGLVQVYSRNEIISRTCML